MLIELSDDFIEVDFALDGDVACCLNGTLLSARNGWHLVIGSRDLLRKLWAAENVLSYPARLAARTILDQFADIASTADGLRSRVILSAKSEGVIRLDDHTWMVGAKVFSHGTLGKAVLIGEDLTDTDVLLVAARHYQVECRMTKARINLHHIGGGGNRTAAQFERFVRERSTGVLCITDSDRKYEGSLMKETARLCEQVSNNYVWWAKHIALPTHELENLLPLELIRAAALDGGRTILSERLKALESLPASIRIFGDLKCGLKLREILGMNEGDPMKKFWIGVYSDLKRNGGFVCGCEGGRGAGEAECECELVPKLGEDLAKIVCKYLEKQPALDRVFSRSRKETLFEMWLEMGREVFEWGVSARPSRL